MSGEKIKAILESMYFIGLEGEQAELAGRVVAHEIETERERCAKIADQWAIASQDAEDIAKAIRGGQ